MAASWVGKAVMAAALLAVVAGLAGSIGWVVRGHMDRRSAPAATAAPVIKLERPEKASKPVQTAVPESSIQANLAQAITLRHSEEPGQRKLALEKIREAVRWDPSPALRHHLRNEAIACLALPVDVNPAKTWPGWPEGSGHYDFDGKLEIYARSDRRGNVSVRRVADDKEIGRVFDPHTGETWVRLSPDGQFLLTQHGEMLKVWQLGTSKPPLVLERKGHAYDFHPEKPQVAVAVKEGALEVVDLIEGKTQPFRLEAKISALVWRPQGKQIALAYSDGVKVLDLDSDHQVATLETNVDRGGHSLAWHPEGRLLAIVADGGHVQLWNVRDEQQVLVLPGPARRDIRLAFNHRGNLLASTAADNLLRLWDPRSGQQLKRLVWGCSELPRFHPDDRLMAACIHDNSLKMWDITCDEAYRTLTRDPPLGPGNCASAAIGLEGRLLATAMEDGVGLWDLKTACFIGLLEAGVTCSVVFEGGPSDALVSNGPKGVLRWPVRADFATGQLRIGSPEELSLAGNKFQIAVSHDERFVVQAAGAAGGRVLWLNPKKSIGLTPPADARYVAVSPDGVLVATGSHSGVGVHIWDARSGKLVQELLPKTPSMGVEFSSDGKWLATQSSSCQLWKVGTWEKAYAFRGTQFAFAPDAKVLAVESGTGVVRLMDPTNGEELARLPNPFQDPAERMCFSPDGSQLVTLGSESYPLHVWDLRKIRRQLADLGLDWDMPPYAGQGPAWNGGPLQKLETNP